MARQRSGRMLSSPRYRAVRGLSYGGHRIPAGGDCPDLPAASISWLHADGHIEPIPDDETSREDES